MILISKEHADYQGIKFVVTAVSHDVTRFILMHLNIRQRDGKLIIEGTDGRRYHAHYLSGPEFTGLDANNPFETGIYDYWITTDRNIIINKRKDDGVVFPKCEDVIPKAEHMAKRENVRLEVNEFISHALHLTGGSFDVNFMGDICSYRLRRAGKNWPRRTKPKLETPCVVIQQENKVSSLLVSTDQMMAVLMPIRIKE